MTIEKKKRSLTAFSILFIILIALWVVSYLCAGSNFAPMVPTGGTDPVSVVVAPSISTFFMSPFNGFVNAIEISIFILVLGGFLNIIMKTGSLEAGIQALVKRLKGNEIIIIPILMFLFSIGGTVYGMAEETIAFYALITATLVAAKFDTLVAVGTVLLGAGAGVLGSTVNPFATGVAVAALKGIGVPANQAIIITVGTILWLTTTIFCIWYVVRYAKKVKADKGSTILTLQEQKDMVDHFTKDDTKDLHFSKKHKRILYLFGFTFFVMIISLIPWETFNIHIFDGWTAILTGKNFGEWYFSDLAIWFLVMAIVVSLFAGMAEKEIVDSFIDGAKDILSVVLIIVVARAASVIMSDTHLDLYVLDRASDLLSGLSPILFVPVAYIIYLGLSFLIPSTSGLAFVSIPILGGLTARLGMDANIMIMIFCGGSGLVNLVTPTSGVVMGGLQISKVQYSTWWNFMKLPLIYIGLMNIIILVVAMLVI